MKILMVLFLWMSSGCSLMKHQSFLSQMNQNTDGFFVPGKRFPVASGDKGKAFRNRDDIRKRTPLSKRKKSEFAWKKSLEDELYNKEKALNPREYEEYMDSTAYLGHISEKIYYLNLSAHQRKNYIKGKQFREKKYRQKKRGISFLKMKEFGRNEIRPGMDKREVLERWGRPVRVDVAGNPAKQNERWSFYHSGRLRQIYFEKGLVQGWRMDDE